MRGLFVTGTDTGVGKTAVTCAIASAWRLQGRSFSIRKPVSTGGNADAQALSLVSGQSAADITPLVFREPAAPPVAAAAEGHTLTISQLEQACRADAEAVLVEGVGGLLCPLTADSTVADLAAALALPLVIVARRSLGTLNHTLMTFEIACGRGLPVAGVIVSETEPVEGLAAISAVDEMQRRGVPVLAILPHGADRLTREVDWWSVAGSVIEQRARPRGREGVTASCIR